MEKYLVKSKSELRIEAGVKVDTLIGIVEDIKTIVLQLNTEWGYIDKEYRGQDNFFRNGRKRAYAHEIVTGQRVDLFNSMGSEMIKIKRSIEETNNTKLMAEVANIPLEPLSEFYNMTIGYFADDQNPSCSFGGVLDALMCIQEIRDSYKIIASQPQQAPTTSSPIFPKELDTPEARAIFDRAIKEGLIAQDGKLYRWIGEFGERKELAYFIKCFNVSILKKPREIKENRPRYNSERFIIAPFQRLFNVTAISQEIQKPLRKWRYKKVDSFFK